MERSWFGELLIEKCLHWTIEGGWEGTENLLEPSIPRECHRLCGNAKSCLHNENSHIPIYAHINLNASIAYPASHSSILPSRCSYT